MKIYTKTGDKGTTALIGGERVPKNDSRVETYGTIDELNSWLGLIGSSEIAAIHKQELKNIQQTLFSIGAWFAASGNDTARTRLHRVPQAKIEALENSIDMMNKKLPMLKSFVLPGGCIASGYISVARTICRRAERCAVKIASETDALEISYLNRLSDWLFVLSRMVNVEAGVEELYLE